MKVKVPKTYSLRENTRMFHQTVKTVEKTRQAAYSTSKRTEQQFWCDSWSDIQHRHFIITISVTMSWSTCPAIFFTLPMKVSSTPKAWQTYPSSDVGWLKPHKHCRQPYQKQQALPYSHWPNCPLQNSCSTLVWNHPDNDAVHASSAATLRLYWQFQMGNSKP